MKSFNWKRRNVFVVFDSDILDKSSVKNAYKSLKTALEELGATVKIIPLPPELNGEKNGVDDFIFRHGKSQLLPNGLIILPSYHPSPRNVNTKLISNKMMVNLFKKAKKLAKF